MTYIGKNYSNFMGSLPVKRKILSFAIVYAWDMSDVMLQFFLVILVFVHPYFLTKVSGTPLIE